MHATERALIDAALAYAEFERKTAEAGSFVTYDLDGLQAYTDVLNPLLRAADECQRFRTVISDFAATEILVWNSLDTPPDADALVLLHFGYGADDAEVYPASFDGEFWYLESGTRIVKPVIEWAHMPVGTRAAGVSHG